jgi:DNA-binding winged helix-turn-helix (wHTH) protein
MPDNTTFDTKLPTKFIAYGILAIVVILGTAATLLFINLPDANAFNAQVERIFVENDAITGAGEIRLLEILAQSGTAFSETLASYRVIIFVLMIFATALLIASLVFLVFLTVMARRMAMIDKAGIQVKSLVVSRDHSTVQINDLEFKLTDAAFETLSVLAEARLDDDILSGLEIEAMISGKPQADCDEASGATRIKRLRDHLGNQMMSELLIKTISRKGYALTVEPSAIRIE